jgi:hypothetical protein
MTAHQFTGDAELRRRAAAGIPLVEGGQGRSADDLGVLPLTGWLVAGCAIVSTVCLRVIL